MNSGVPLPKLELGEGIRFLSHIPLISRDPLGAFGVRQHQDVEELGAGSGPECVQALL